MYSSRRLSRSQSSSPGSTSSVCCWDSRSSWWGSWVKPPTRSCAAPPNSKMEHESSFLYEPFNRYIWRHAFGFDVPDHVIMALLVLAISTVLCIAGSRRISRDNPGPLQHFLAMIVGGLKGLLHDVIGHGGERYLNIIAAFAVFIFISNIFGLFYFLQPPTSNTNTTFALSISAFLYYNIEGISRQGLGGYMEHLMCRVLSVAPRLCAVAAV